MGPFNLSDIVNKHYDNAYFLRDLSDDELIIFLEGFILEEINSLNLTNDLRTMLKSELDSWHTNDFRIMLNGFSTMRHLKAFKKYFRDIFKKIRCDINLRDIINLSIIRITHFHLFDFIRVNKHLLGLSVQLLESVDIFSPERYYANLRHGLSNSLLNSKLNDDEKKAIPLIFPHTDDLLNGDSARKPSDIHSTLSKYYDSYLKERRIAHYLLLQKYFEYDFIADAIRDVTNMELRRDLVNILSHNSNYLEDAISMYEKLVPLGIRNKDLRRTTYIWFNDIITDNSNPVLSHNLLISFSYYNKRLKNDSLSYFGFEEKKLIPYLVWTYVKRFDNNKSIFKELISDHPANSDTFSDTILYYTLNPENIEVKITEDEKSKIVDMYINRLYLKLDKDKTIFDTNVFDDSYYTIWRWLTACEYLSNNAQLSDYPISLQQHIYDNTIQNPRNFELIIQYSFDSTPRESPIFLDKNLIRLYRKENLVEVVKAYLTHEKEFSLEEGRIKALKNWLTEQIK